MPTGYRMSCRWAGPTTRPWRRIDIGGRDFARTKKFRNVKANPKVALAIDDVLPPWRPRCVMVRGTAEALDQATSADGEPLGPTIRIHPAEVLSWGLDAHRA